MVGEALIGVVLGDSEKADLPAVGYATEALTLADFENLVLNALTISVPATRIDGRATPITPRQLEAFREITGVVARTLITVGLVTLPEYLALSWISSSECLPTRGLATLPPLLLVVDLKERA